MQAKKYFIRKGLAMIAAPSGEPVKLTIMADAELMARIDAERRRIADETGLPRVPVSRVVTAAIRRGLSAVAE